ncbi:g4802 [Coccomyxa elongata]
MVCWIVIDRPHLKCYEGAAYQIVLTGIFSTFSIFFILGSWTIYEGLKGSIFETRKRARVPYLLYALSLVLIAEIAFNAYGSWLVEQPRERCELHFGKFWTPQNIGRALVWTTWALIGILLVLAIMVFNSFPDYRSQKSWERRCHCLMVVLCCHCCRATDRETGEQPPYARMGQLFSQLFGCVDWAPSDLIATFLLAGAAQTCRRRSKVEIIAAAGGVPEAPPRPSPSRDGQMLIPASRAASLHSASSADMMLAEGFLDMPPYDVEAGAGINPLVTPSGMGIEMRPDLTAKQAAAMQCCARDAVSDADIEEAAYFSKYAFAAYGYMLYIWSKPQFRGWCELCCGRGCGCCIGPIRRYQEAFSAGRWMPTLAVSNYMNHEAILQITNIKEEDIVFVRFDTEVIAQSCLPYFIALDHKTKSVVIGIRGTLSMEDLVTDFMCEPAEMDDWLGTATTSHSGHFSQAHDPGGLVGSSQGMGFFNRGDTGQGPICQRGGFRIHPESGEDMKSGRVCSNLHASTSSRSDVQETSPPRQRFSRHSSTERLETVRSGIPGFLEESSKLHSRGKSSGGQRASMNGGTDKESTAKHCSDPDDDLVDLHSQYTASENRSFRAAPPDVQVIDRHSRSSAHSGILKAAKGVVEDLVKEGVLAALMEGRPVPPNNKVTPDCRNWSIVLTGHSLGAGAAALVALYIRSFYPNSRCWAFEPPGGLVDGTLAEAAADCVTSVVLGKDWVPRLSLASFERLRDEMVVAGLRCKKSKTEFLLRSLMGHRWTREELFTNEAAARPEANVILSQMTAMLQHSSSVGARYEIARNFRPPGRLMFLRPMKTAAQEKASRRTYDPVWITAEDLVEEGILVSPRMMADHMPDYLTAVLRRMAHERASQDAHDGAADKPGRGRSQGSAPEREARSNEWAAGGEEMVAPTSGQEQAARKD